MKRFTKKAVLFAAIGLCMASCKGYYYQVYDVSSNNTKMQDNSLVYENEDCKVLYNLWSNNGKLRFAILNKFLFTQGWLENKYYGTPNDRGGQHFRRIVEITDLGKRQIPILLKNQMLDHGMFGNLG